MKKLIIPFASIILLFFTACEKCADCTCSGTWTYNFSDSISDAGEQAIRNAYDAEFNSQYPDKTEEVCAKRKDFDETLASYKEDNSLNFKDSSKVESYPWSVSGFYDCICLEQ
ncbi:MAG: hypothetical protein WEC59_12050 [Salibacteraceae bacterium]